MGANVQHKSLKFSMNSFIFSFNYYKAVDPEGKASPTKVKLPWYFSASLDFVVSKIKFYKL